MPGSSRSLINELAHLGRGPNEDGRQVNLPIIQGSTVLLNSLGAFEAARDARFDHDTLYYRRYGNPAAFELERAMKALEGGHGCVAVSAGLTAVTLALHANLKAGDHLLVADHVYGPTRSFCDTVLTRFGVEVSYFDPMIGNGLPEAGLLPAFIEWSPCPHPSSGMQDLGIMLETVRLSHPDPTWLKGILTALGVDHHAEVIEGLERSLAFALSSPNGDTVLD